MDKLSIVVPCYNEENVIETFYNKLMEITEKISDKYDYEVIFVDDGSKDETFPKMKNLRAKNDKIKIISFSRNFGKEAGIHAGLSNSTGELTVVMDADLQHPPEIILEMLKYIEEGYDTVATRRKNRKDSLLKVFVSKVFYKIYSFASDGYYDPAICNFSISKRIVIENYCKMRELHRAFVIYIKWLGFKQTAIDVEHDPRKEGKSSYNMKKRLKMAGEILTSQSDKLLRLMVEFGFLMTFISFIAIIVFTINYFTKHVMAGWTSIIAVNCLIGGMIIMVVGLVGIYVGNIFMKVKDRPLYVIRQILNDNKNE